MTTHSKPIICCGFTPCIQRILEYKKLRKGEVNRAVRVSTCIGGKGANTARMARQLGGHPVLVGFVGGANGVLLEQMLDAEEIGYRHVMVECETRICQTLVEAGNPETTELVEEMPSLSPDNWEHMMKLLGSLDVSGAVVPICGKLPAGAPADAYAQLVEVCADRNGCVILDAPGEPMLRALKHKPFMVKINDAELFDAVAGSDVVASAGVLIQKGAQSVLITRGGRSAFFVDGSNVLEIVPPKIKAVNPVGSGDAVTAGLATSIQAGMHVSDALIRAMACGAANALHLISGSLNPDEVDRLREAVEIRVIR